MITRTAAVLGRRRPLIVKVPVLMSRRSFYRVALATRVEAGLARPLIDGLNHAMVVHPPRGVDDRHLGFEDAVRAALP